MKRIALCLIVLSTLPRTLAAAEVPLALGEALEKAKANSAHLAQLASLQKAADAALKGARAQRWPVVDFNATYSLNSDVPELSIIEPGPPPTRQVVFPNIPHQYKTRAGVAVPIYTGGRVSGQVAAARGAQDAARLDLVAGSADIRLETESAYWGLVTARESARVLRESIASYDTHLKDAKNRFDLGLAARNEVLAVQVERDRAELARLQAENQSDVANANLVRLVGLPPDSRVVPTETVAGPAAAEAGATEELVLAALQARPEVASAQSRLSSAEAQARIERAASLPQLSAFASYDYSRPNTRILPLVDEWNGTWSVGASVSWVAFNGGRTRAAVAEAQAEAEAARHQLRDLEERIRLEVTTERGDLDTARAALLVAERNLASARESVKVETDRYHEGVGFSSELLDAETRLLRAGLDLTEALTSIRVARAGLDRAVGR
jgi:outer membrane protein TolC